MALRLVVSAAAFGLLAGCGEADRADDAVGAIRAPEIAEMVAVDRALDGALVPTLDPATMNEAEIRKAVGTGPRCTFRYTSSGKPVLAVALQPGGTPGAAVVKLNGSLVALEPAAAADPAGGLVLEAAPVRMAVAPAPGDGIDGEATAVFEVGRELRVGYRGYIDCGPGASV